VRGETWVRFPAPELPLFPHFFQTKDLVVQKIADMCSMQPKPLARVWCTAQAPFSWFSKEWVKGRDSGSIRGARMSQLLAFFLILTFELWFENRGVIQSRK
jgi:hypothetical protein